MKKIFLSVIIVLMIFCETVAFGVSSDVATKADIQFLAGRIDALGERLNDTNKRIDDVITNTNARFEDVIANTNARIDDVITNTNARFDALDKRIDDVITTTNTRINDLRAEMNSGFSGVDREISGVRREIDNLRHDIYWGLAFLGLILGGPIYGPALKKFFVSFAGLKSPVLSDEEREALRIFVQKVREDGK